MDDYDMEIWALTEELDSMLRNRSWWYGRLREYRRMDIAIKRVKVMAAERKKAKRAAHSEN